MVAEKSRVVHQNRDERNFHIFYQLCSGSTKEMQGLQWYWCLWHVSVECIERHCLFLESLGITSPEYYHYLSQSQCTRVDGTDDSKDFEDTLVFLHDNFHCQIYSTTYVMKSEVIYYRMLWR